MNNLLCVLAALLLPATLIQAYQPPYSSTFLKDQDVVNVSLAVGKSATGYDVSPTGAFTFNLPLDIPAGRNNVQPSLSLVYNSQAGNGSYGYGWSLSGTSAITLSNQTLFHDDKVEGIFAGSDERFALDGNRLFALQGVYGANATVYGGEQENYVKITSHGQLGSGPLWFEVETKSGMVLEYGNHTLARTLDGTGQKVLIWSINKATDRFGNYMTYAYDFWNDGEPHLDYVAYTGNSQTGNAPFASIDFIYSTGTRTDENQLYMTREENVMRMDKLLSAIDVKVGSQSYKRYEFLYAFQDNYSYLNEIKESNGTLEYNSTRFSYWDAGHNIENSQTLILAGTYDYLPGDFNGDGVSDLLRAEIYYNHNGFKGYSAANIFLGSGSGNGTFNSSAPLSITLGVILDTKAKFHANNNSNEGMVLCEVGDFNGDGKDDIVTAHGREEKRKVGPFGLQTEKFFKIDEVRFYYSECHGYQTSFAPAQSMIIPADNYVGEDNFFTTGDFNGDNARDLYCAFTDGLKEQSNHIHNDSQPVIYCPRINTAPFSVSGIPNQQGLDWGFNDRVYPLDMDGDGRNDIIQLGAGGTYNDVWEFIFTPGSQQVAAQKFDVLTNLNHTHHFRFGDYNGDGKTDILRSTDRLWWNIWLSNGTNFEHLWQVNPLNLDIVNPSEAAIRVADCNGDGKADILWTNYDINSNSTQWELHYSYGLQLSAESGVLSNTAIRGHGLTRLLDIEGDGATELFSARDIFSYFNITDFNSDDRKPGLMHIASTGLKEIVEVSYASIAGDSPRYLYTPAATHQALPAYPLMELHKPLFVTHVLDEPDGSGVKQSIYENGRLEKHYFYREARFHLEGKGFLGFTAVEFEERYGATMNLGNVSGSDKVFLNHTLYELGPLYIPRVQKFHRSLTSPPVGEAGGITFAPTRTMHGNLYSRETTYLDLPLSADSRTVGQPGYVIEGFNIEGYTVETTYDYSAPNALEYGNPTKITIDRAGGLETEVTALQYGQFGTHIPSSVTRRDVETTRQGQPTLHNIVTYDYDIVTGAVKEEQQHYPLLGGGLSPQVKIEHGYTAMGSLDQSTQTVFNHSAPVRLTEYFYDAEERFLEKQVSPLGYTEEWQYDAISGNVLVHAAVNANNVTTNLYDDLHRLVSNTDAFGNVTTIDRQWSLSQTLPIAQVGAADVLYRVLTSTLSLGKSSVVWYDRLGRERLQEMQGYDVGQKNRNYTHYDHFGKVRQSSTPFEGATEQETVSLGYDELGRVVSQSRYAAGQPPVNTVINNYTMTGNAPFVYTTARTIAVTTERADGVKKTEHRDGSGRVFKVFDHNRIIEYDYTSTGDILSVTVDGQVMSVASYDLQSGLQTALDEVNSGVTTYQYNALGELIDQEDAKGEQVNGFLYDELGRILQKSTPEGVFTYSYFNSGPGIGQIAQMVSPNGVTTSYDYTNNGQISKVTENIAGQTFVAGYDYNSLGRLSQETWHSGTVVNYIYTATGYLDQLVDAGNSTIYFDGHGQNAYGQWTRYTLGNGIISSRTYDSFGRPAVINAAGTFAREYQFDAVTANLVSRSNLLTGVQESFSYDDYDRLEEVRLNATLNLTMKYGSQGIIDFQSGLGVYTYNPVKLHAVRQINFSAPPVQTPEAHNIKYNFNQDPLEITNGSGKQATYSYDGLHRRKLMTLDDGQGNITKRYYGVNAEYEFDPATNVWQMVDYISGGDGLCAMVVTTTGQSPQAYGVYRDYLGSICVVTDMGGGVVADISYDSWGRYRDEQTWQGTPTDQYTPVKPSWLWRGYTGHEHLAEFCLIHMNGRLYDPIVGRMLCPDNYVPDLRTAQSYDRYAYVLNNPLKYSDPSGNVPAFVVPWISMSAGGGMYVGLTAGIGTPGVLSSQVTVGYGIDNSDVFASLGGTVSGLTASVGYGTESGYTAGLNYGVLSFTGSSGIGNNLSSIGVNYSQNGGASANAFGFAYGSGGITFSPSFGYSMTFTYAPAVTHAEKREQMLEEYKDELIAHHGQDVFETTKFRSTRLPRSLRLFGVTTPRGIQETNGIVKSNNQVVAINRRYINRWYRGVGRNVVKGTVFHEYFHAREFHNGVTVDEYYYSGPYRTDPLEVRAFRYELNNFGTGGWFFK